MNRGLKIILLAAVLSLCSVNMTCDDADDLTPYDGNCDQNTMVDNKLYKKLKNDLFTLVRAEILGDCLEVEIGDSGCSAESWELHLVDSGEVAESLPEQRFLKFQFINEEECLAYFTKTVSFDLSPVQVEGSNEIILHIEGLETSINYKY